MSSVENGDLRQSIVWSRSRVVRKQQEKQGTRRYNLHSSAGALCNQTEEEHTNSVKSSSEAHVHVHTALYERTVNV